MRDGELAAKKAALSKALSAAYLSHQIADLESRVNTIGVTEEGSVPDAKGMFQTPALSSLAWPRSPAKRHGQEAGLSSPGAFPPLGGPPVNSGPGNPNVFPGSLAGPAAPGFGPGVIGGPPGPGVIGGPPGPGGPRPASHSPPGASPVPPFTPQLRNSAAQPADPTAAVLGVEPHIEAPTSQPAAQRDPRRTSSHGTRDLVDNDEPAGRIDDSDGEEAWRVSVVDVSALMWAPQAVRSLLQRGGEVVIPQDAIRTLDLLKKGNSAAAVAARAAARFVEHASRHHRPISADPSLTVQAGTNYKRSRGLRLQRDDEVEPLRSDASNEGDAPPRWVARVLGCAAYFQRIMRAEGADEMAPAVLIAHPPPSAEVGPPPVDERRTAPEVVTSYADRGEGYTLSLEAGRFEMGLEVLRDEDGDDEPPRHRRRGHGHGHGAPGHGHGHGGEGRRGRGKGRGRHEPEPEQVKILLRRPEPDEPVSAMDAPPPPHMPPPPHHMPPPPMPGMPMGMPPPPPFFERGGHGGRGGRGGRGRGGGGGGRGRGGGGGGGRGQDRGGGFTLLQRPGPPLAHHVRDVSSAERGDREREGRGKDREKKKDKRERRAEFGWRGAYASNDGPEASASVSASASKPKVVLLQRPR